MSPASELPNHAWGPETPSRGVPPTFCRACGNALDSRAVICPRCGVARAAQPIQIGVDLSAQGIQAGREPVLAGWWARVGATLLDGLILLVPLIVCYVIAALSLGGIARLILYYALALTVSFAYYLTMTRSGARNGQSFGHQILRIRVTTTDGQPINISHVAIRQVLVQGLLFGLIAPILLWIPSIVNYLFPLWDNENQALHDKLARTLVIRCP